MTMMMTRAEGLHIHEDVFSDGVRREALFNRLEQWDPTVPQACTFSWACEDTPDGNVYGADVEANRQEKLEFFKAEASTLQ